MSFTKSIFVNKSQFCMYKGCSVNTGRKKYIEYLKKIGKDKDQELTIYDLNRIDFVPLEDIMDRIGMTASNNGSLSNSD